MDYKEKYEQALERAKYYHDRDNIQFLENIFPELAESEEERIRKDIISLVKETKVTERYYDLSKMLAWLEKQDEQKPIDKIEQDSSWSEENDDDAWLNDIISKAECNLQLNKDEIDFLKSIKDRVQPQPRQEWSEDDERMISDIDNCIKNLPILYETIKINGEDKTTKQFVYCARNWLKSLRDRVFPRPEWSEEEKARIDRIIDVLDWAEEKGRISYSDWEDYVCYVKCLRPQSNTKWYKVDDRIQKEIINFFECQKKDEPTRKDTINKWIDWLKDRVLPQSQWKPSGEQIMAIDTAINVLGKGTLNGKQLIELYQDLKKLKGEEI